MELQYQELSLPLEFPFRISRSSETVARTVRVELTLGRERDAPLTGLGEAVPSPFYGEDVESVQRFYDQVIADSALESNDPHNLQAFEARMAAYPGNRAAKAGLEIALQDLRGKAVELPLHRLWGLDRHRLPKTSYTIGIAEPDKVKQKTRAALERSFDVLKVKLGGEHDLETLQLIREMAPHATLRVDANAGWKLDEAERMCRALAEFHVEFVEAPLSLDHDDDAYARLREVSPLPLMADEDCHTLGDIPRCARLFDAINIKPTKTGGLEEALRMVHAAQAHDLKIMLGGFVETSISVTAIGQLAPLVDYCDLDACLLIAHDPYFGLEYHGSTFQLPDRPGIGVIPRP